MDFLDAAKRVVAFPQLAVRPPVAVQHNELVEACYSMTLIEKRILMHGISKIFSLDFPKKGDQLEFKLCALEFKRIFNVHHGSVYDELKAATLALGKRQVFIKHRPSESMWFNWLDSCYYWENEGVMSVKFSQTASVYLMGLQEQFTSIDLLQLADLKSFYSVRLYELLRQWKATGYRVMTVDEFRDVMQCQEQYPKFSKLKMWVLDPAIADINANTDLTVSLVVCYERRKASRLEFSFTPQASLRW